eukprot:Sspe_Gene.32814::Locus_16068_Transcript_1_3_Confidence_0.500_Length_2362::g.32814::m.32814/K12180/COPS7, CSN7; COP9 signalosome complex subunit 7
MRSPRHDTVQSNARDLILFLRAHAHLPTHTPTPLHHPCATAKKKYNCTHTHTHTNKPSVYITFVPSLPRLYFAVPPSPPSISLPAPLLSPSPSAHNPLPCLPACSLSSLPKSPQFVVHTLSPHLCNFHCEACNVSYQRCRCQPSVSLHLPPHLTLSRGRHLTPPHTMADLAHYCTMAKSSKGRAAAAVVSEALSTPHIFVFGELLDVPSVAELASGENKQVYDLLQIFAYDTYTEYKANKAVLPELTPPQLHKLKQLTIVALASKARVLHYTELSAALDIADVRELEDTIIDAITNGLLNAKIDQAKGQVEVLDVIGRDVRPTEIDQMLSVLNKWFNESSAVIDTLDDLIGKGQASMEEKQNHGKQLHAKIQAQRKNVLSMMSEMGLEEKGGVRRKKWGAGAAGGRAGH